MNKTNKKNIMTEEDIDKLFNKSKSKNRTEIVIEEWPKKIKDFVHSIKFLKVDD
jgi:hypothetical protein